MITSKPVSKIMAWLLICAMIFTTSPITAGAEQAPTHGASGEIIAFAALPGEIASQTVPLGTSMAALALPGALTAMVRPFDTATPATSGGSAETDEAVPATWESDPDYDGDTAGTYVFTASVEGYAVSAKLPTITVTVEMAAQNPPAPVVITNFDPEPYHQPADPGATNIAVAYGTPESDIPLPMTLNATIDGGEENAYAVAVASWECTQKMSESFQYVPGGYDPDKNGVYLFAPTLALGANESLAAGVTPPAIEVVVMPAEDGVGITPLASSSYAIDNNGTIASHQSNMQNLLNSAGSGNSVTVTGSRTGMATRLALNIPSGVTLIWRANLSGNTASYNPILNITGAGGFTMDSGSLLNGGDMGYTLQSSVTGNILITGTAQITSTGGLSTAIDLGSGGTLTINGSAQVSSTGATSNAISISDGANLTVGDDARVNAAHAAITNSGSGTVKVGDSSSVTGGGYGINSRGNVEVSGGTVTGTGNSGPTILSIANVTVSGSSTVVRATGSGNNAIVISNGIAVAVDIQGGTVSSNGITIQTQGTTTKVDVTISGGTVSSANSYAIYNDGSASVVTVSGGEVTGASTYTIFMQNSSNTGGNVVVSNTGKVRNTAGGSAIRSYGGVKVEGNALVTATTGNAIYSRDAVIAGGAVFAYGTAITGSANVIRLTSGTYTPPVGDGVAIAWDKDAGVANYAQGSKLHITAQPQDKAYWSENSGASIQYASGSATGFIPIPGVTIGVGDIPPAALGVSIDAAAPLVGTQLTGSYTYNAGSGAGGGVQSGSTYQWYRGNTATWNGAGHTAIPGATATTYIPNGDDIGKYLYFEVRPSNGTLTGDAVHSAASAQVGLMITLTVNQSGTNGTAYIGTTAGVTSYKAVSTASPALRSTLNSAVGVTWSVTSGGGSIANSTALNTSYAFPSPLSSITGPITINAAFTPDTVLPVLSDVSVDMVSDTTAALHFKSTKAGTYYYLVYAVGDPPPTDAAAVIAQNTGVTRGTGAVTANQPMSVTMSNLIADTGYKVYVVVKDSTGQGNISDVSSCDFSTVSAELYGLIFFVNVGKMYLTDPLSTEYTDPEHWSWDNVTKTLTLNNFNRVTSAQNALTLMGEGITLKIEGANSFMSTYSGIDNTSGIYVSKNITVTGDGTLEAIGGSPTGSGWSSGIYSDGSLTLKSGSLTAIGGSPTGSGWSRGIYLNTGSLTLESGSLTAIGGAAQTSYGISFSNDKSLTINGGTLTARGSTGGNICRAFYLPTNLTVTLPAKYVYWVNSGNYRPAGAGTVIPGGTPLTLSSNYGYVSIQEIPPSPEKGLTSVAGEDTSALTQDGMSGSPVAGTVNVANGVAELSLADIISAGKSFQLYRDTFITEVTDPDTIALTPGGATTVYIKVKAEDATEAYYAITINRAPDTVIDIMTIDGITPPAYGGTPMTAITGTEQYSGTVTWSPAHNPFRAGTAYTATITLTPEPGYTLTGVTGDFFDVPGAMDTRNATDSGIVTASFSPTAAPSIAVTHTGLTGLKVGASGSGTVLYTLSNGVYVNTIVEANFEVTGLPAGLSQSVIRTNDIVVTVTVTGTPAAANASSVNLGIPFSIPAANVQGATAAVVPSGTVTVDTIAKGTGLTATSHNISIVSTDTAQHTFDLDSIVFNQTNPGYRSYVLSTFANTGSVLAGAPTLLGSTLSYTGSGQSAGSATQDITIITDNYADATVTITFNAVVKTPANVIATAPAYITYGGTLGDPSAIASAGGTSFTYNYSGILSDGSNTTYGPIATKPTAPGSYTVTATLVSDTYAGSGTSSAFYIYKKDLSWNAGVVNDKTYDGDNSATVSTAPTLSGIINSDTVAVIAGTAVFSDKDAAVGKTVTGSSWSIGSTDTWKYNIPSEQPTFANAEISTKSITVNDGDIFYSGKTYDGTTAATDFPISPITLTVKSGIIGSDTVTAGYTSAAFDSAEAGSQAVTVSGLTLDGTQAGNYSLSNITASKTATITKATAPGSVTHTLRIGIGDSIDVNLDALLPSLTAPLAYGTVSYEVTKLTDDDSILDEPATEPTASPLTITVAAGTTAGDAATIEVTVSSANFADFSVTITVTVSLLPVEATPAATIDYVSEKLTGLTANAAYSIDGNANITADANGAIVIDSSWLGTTISIVKKGDDVTSADSNPQTLPIPIRPDVPGGVGKTDITGATNNGTITGVTTEMEYKLSTATSWTACGDTTVTGLAAGTYYIRLKATVNSFAGEHTEITIYAVTHAVTFNVVNGNGSLAATVDGMGITSGGLVQQGKDIVFTASPNAGYRVKEWKDNNDTVNGTNTGYTIGSIAAVHTVTVEFELIPPPSYLLSIEAGTGGSISEGLEEQYALGTVINIAAVAKSGYRFNGWTSSAGGAFGDEKASATTFTMPGNAVTITANFKYSGGGSSSGGTTGSGTTGSGGATGGSTGDSGSGTAASTGSGASGDSAATTTDTGASGDATATTTDTGASGDSAATTTDTGVSGDSAVNTTDTGASGSITMTTPGDQPPVTDDGGNTTLPGGGTVQTEGGSIISVPQGTVIDKDGKITIPAEQEAGITLPGGNTTVTLPGGSIIDSNGNVTVGSNGSAQINLNGETHITVSGGSTIENGATITVGEGGATIHYGDTTLFIEEDTILILDDEIPLGYFAFIKNPFTDVTESDWFYNNVIFVYTHGLFSGTSTDPMMFSPGASMTRGMFVAVLARLEGADLSSYTSSRFADVLPGQWYSAPVEWAADLGLVNGVGNGNFDPNAPITREQMAVMLFNYMWHKGIAASPEATDAFEDEGSISAWALEAVRAIKAMGIVGGKPGNLFDPQGTATRAEVATVFANYINFIANRGVIGG